MKKSDLKDGMIVELRNGDMCIVLGDKLLDTDSFTYIYGYTDDLIEESGQDDLDIVKVYKDRKLLSLEDRYKRDKLELLWERKEVDWRTVKFGTKVRVWNKGYFGKYEGVLVEYKPNDKDYPFRVYVKDEDWDDCICWKYCELA